ncbi:MAG TPA: DUF892 family protein [Candidatus Paceibacterota bacterium]|nr:DUF892 family protein [Candidatus Paceibacterota bacterium]
MDKKEQVIAWLADAHAMEMSIVEVLERHMKDAESQPDIAGKLKEHLEQTKEHAQKVEACLTRLGGDPSAAKDVLSKAMGMIKGMSTDVYGDQLVKNIIAEHTTEHFEMACYASLIAAAEEIGDQETAQTAREILKEEEQMAMWTEGQIGKITKLHLSTLD